MAALTGHDTGASQRIRRTDVVEARLQRIWERVLGVSGIGVRQSFFEVGGHSILGVRLDEIERELAVPLPLAGLFEEATIERLAAIIRSIRGREQGADLGVLLPIQPNGSRPPLYCVHPSGGSVHYYFRFAHAFDDDQPVYGLQAAGLEGDGEPDTTIEAMAARYVAEIRRFQPDGPYRLLGWSLGGIVVFEMARQLRDLGERVDLAAVVDADAVSYEPPPGRDDLLLRMLLRADTEFAIDEAELTELDDDERLDRIVELARQAEVLPPLMPMARVLRLIAAMRSTDEALARYRLRPAVGRLHVFRAEDSPGGEEDLGWGRFADEVRLNPVAGDHYSVFGTHCQALADAVGLAIAETSAVTEGGSIR